MGAVVHICVSCEAPVQAQSVKIEPSKSFGGKNDEDIDSWIFSMDLYF